MKNLLKSVQFKRKCSFIGLGLGAIALSYLSYYWGRSDEIDEICDMVYEHGDICLTFISRGRRRCITMYSG